MDIKNLTLNNKKLKWTDPKVKLCAICFSAHHNATSCPKRCQTPKDRSMQNLYQCFQPTQFTNYTAPKRSPIRGAVRDNITFTHVTKNLQQSNNSQDSPKKRPLHLPCLNQNLT